MKSYFDEKLNTKLLLQEMLQKLCFNPLDNHICMDCRYFKLLTNMNISMDIILNCIMTIVNQVLSKFSQYIFHVNFKSFSISDCDKYRLFMTDFSSTMDKSYPDALEFCYIYNPSFVISMFHGLFDMLISKNSKSKNKIQIVKVY